MNRADLNYCAAKLGDALELLVLGFHPGVEDFDNPILKERVLRAWYEAKYAELFLPEALLPKFQKLYDQATSEPAITEEEGEIIQSIGIMSDEALIEFAKGILELFEEVVEMRAKQESWE
jgi:hypothetical protein